CWFISRRPSVTCWLPSASCCADWFVPVSSSSRPEASDSLPSSSSPTPDFMSFNASSSSSLLSLTSLRLPTSVSINLCDRQAHFLFDRIAGTRSHDGAEEVVTRIRLDFHLDVCRIILKQSGCLLRCIGRDLHDPVNLTASQIFSGLLHI